MNLTLDQLLQAFATYNQSIWPAQAIAYGLTLLALLPLLRPSRTATRLTAAILAVFWAWIGLMFWWPVRDAFPPAPFLAAVFVLQGIFFLAEVANPHLFFRLSGDTRSIIGILLFIYTLIYPLVGMLFGHAYPRMALSALFPCPLVVLTFGLLLTSQKRIPKHLLVIPFIWGLSGFYWVFFGMREDAGLVVAGLLGTWLIWRQPREAPLAGQGREAAFPAG
jgi:hypothetical protein